MTNDLADQEFTIAQNEDGEPDCGIDVGPDGETAWVLLVGEETLKVSVPLNSKPVPHTNAEIRDFLESNLVVEIENGQGTGEILPDNVSAPILETTSAISVLRDKCVQQDFEES